MNIVPTSTPKKQQVTLDSLNERKAELKDQIQDQRQLIVASTQSLLSPASFSTYLFKTFSKGLNMVDGVMIGFKMMRTIRGLFRK
jgi:hypothetical protein